MRERSVTVVDCWSLHPAALVSYNSAVNIWIGVNEIREGKAWNPKPKLNDADRCIHYGGIY